MASKLVLTFGTAEGKKTFTYNKAKSSATTGQIKTLMSTMITNGVIFMFPPLMSQAAKMVTTTETSYDLS